MTLVAERISFSYGRHRVVDDVSLTLSPGDFTVLLGPNGGGKSTILSLLSGRLSPSSGEVLLNGLPVSGLPGRYRASKMAVVPQSSPPTLDFSVRERVTIGRRARLSPFQRMSPEDDRAIESAMSQLDVLEFAERPCNKLSGGEQQRVSLAAALVQEPEVLMLDEPTSSLDPAHVVKTVQILKNLPNQPAILLITHDIELAFHCAKHLMLLKDGKIRFQGSSEEILTPANLAEIYGCNAAIKPGVTFF